MTLLKKAKAAPAAKKAVSNDELDAIMNEINELQSEMTESTKKPQPKAAALKVVPGGSEKKSTTPTEAEIAAEVMAEEEESILAEFQAGASSENSLDATLADLGEEPSAGNSILDQVDAESEPSMESDSEPSMDMSSDERTDDLVDEPELQQEEFEEEAFEEEAPAEEISAEDLENAILEKAAEEETEQAPKEERYMAPSNKNGSGSNGEGTLSMTLTGNMNLNIKYAMGGQEVTVGFSDNFLMVQLADGTEFKIPVGRPASALKKVA